MGLEQLSAIQSKPAMGRICISKLQKNTKSQGCYLLIGYDLDYEHKKAPSMHRGLRILMLCLLWYLQSFITIEVLFFYSDPDPL
jgi:hypothetical protein